MGERHPEDGWPVVAFGDQRAFEDWLAANEGGETGPGQTVAVSPIEPARLATIPG